MGLRRLRGVRGWPAEPCVHTPVCVRCNSEWQVVLEDLHLPLRTRCWALRGAQRVVCHGIRVSGHGWRRRWPTSGRRLRRLVGCARGVFTRCVVPAGCVRRCSVSRSAADATPCASRLEGELVATRRLARAVEGGVSGGDGSAGFSDSGNKGSRRPAASRATGTAGSGCMAPAVGSASASRARPEARCGSGVTGSPRPTARGASARS
jgi:hypothetical protein